MKISNDAIRNRMTVLVLTAIIVIFGIMAYRQLPLEAAPDITIPNIFVTTTYRGVSPEDIEKSITIQIEKKLKGLEGIKRISSISLEGSSFINIEFVPGIVIDDALTKVKDKVDQAKKDLPQDLEDDPAVTEINFAEFPILTLSFSGPSGVRQLTDQLKVLRDDLEGVKGVLDVEILGGAEQEIQIQVYPERLALYQVPLSLLEQVVTGENANISGGSIRTVEGRYQLRLPGEFKTAEEAEMLVVATRNGAPVYLRDIGKIVNGVKDRDSRARMNGQESVLLEVRKRAGENVIDIVGEVDKILARYQPSFPPGTVITRINDHSKNIRDMVLDLENNMLTGMFLVVLIVWLTMGLRNSLLVSLSIPLSMLITFIVLMMLGITLNMIVLFSLILAIGMLVDNAIVIIENIYRHMRQGIPRVQAAMMATQEVAWPVLGSTLTTVVAFVPLLWWPGITGDFMSYLPKTVIITLLACQVVAMIINPAMSALFMKVKLPPGAAVRTTSEAEKDLNALPTLTGGGPLLELYRRTLRGALHYRFAIISLAGITLVASIMLWWARTGIRTPIEFFPSIDPATVFVNLKLPQGVDINYADNRVREVACRLFDEKAGTLSEISGKEPFRQYKDCLQFRERRRVTDNQPYLSPSYFPDILYVYESASVTGNPGLKLMGGSENQVGVRFVPLADRRQSSALTVREIAERLKDIPGAEVTVQEEEEGPPTGAPISIEISGDDFAVLGLLADKVIQAVNQVPFVRNVRDDYEQGTPTLELHIDRARTALLGLSSQLIGAGIKAAFNGVNVSTYREGNDDIDIVVRFVEEERRDIEALGRILIPSPTAGLVPLTTVARIEYTGGLSQIKRINHKRVVTVLAEVDETKTTGVTARMQAEKLLGSFEMPAGYNYVFTGENESQQEAQDFLQKAFLVALLLIFLVLVAQFNSAIYPLIIMSSVILSLTGAFLGLAIHRMPFGLIMCGIGIISLAGVVVNNAIVLLDYTLQLIDRGMAVEDAIIAAGATRLRPVLLTAITTILGLVPMIVGISYDFHTFEVQWVSESAQWWKSMAVVVTYGLGVATLLTLGVVPVLLSVLMDVKRIGRRFFPASNGTGLTPS